MTDSASAERPINFLHSFLLCHNLAGHSLGSFSYFSPMFSFRRKPSKKGNDDSAQIHTSPSLPNLSPEGMIWPENLVDLDSIRQELPEEPIHQGATKTSFEGVDHAPILFHKPFRGSPGKAANGPISSLYMSNLPAAFQGVRTSTYSAPSRKNQRRVRIPPTFNLMVGEISSFFSHHYA